ncbi:hypothetical protein [Halobacillus massiliensis]|uniref:hypothetical protein n=1 Tax=Halobacillus massiliensis TaxID=1926286 RepID=UPI0009E4D123|nr:hypothetical protein [Halobacillus massiliensis]
MSITHPVIKQIQHFGYPVEVHENQYGLDALGNEVFEGDLIFVLNEEFFLKETLIQESIELLEVLGAEEKRA